MHEQRCFRDSTVGNILIGKKASFSDNSHPGAEKHLRGVNMVVFLQYFKHFEKIIILVVDHVCVVTVTSNFGRVFKVDFL